MGNAGKSVASGHGARVSSCRCVRSYLTAGGALAGAGILALGLVAAPPDTHGPRTEVRQVRLATFALPPSAHWDALEKFIINQAQTVVPAVKVPAGGAADVPAAVMKPPSAGTTTQLTADSAMDSTMSSEEVNNAAPAATTTALSIPESLLPIVGPIILFAPLILLVILVCPPCALFNFVTGVIQSILIELTPVPAVDGASSATLEAKATTDTRLRDSAPGITTTEGLADAAAVAETGKADISPRVTSIDKRTRTEQVTSTEPAMENEQVSTKPATSTEPATETAKANEASTGPTETKASEPSASESASESAKPGGRSETPRRVVRDSLGAGEQVSDPSHRGNGGRSTTPTAAASGSKGNSSSDGGSSDGDAGGSESE